MAGLLAGVMNPGSAIIEAGPDREVSHQAVLRMRTPEISRMTGIPFKRVQVHKGIWSNGKEAQASPRLAHLYSQKVVGNISGRSIYNLEPCERFVPPSDFLSQLKSRVGNKIAYDYPADKAVIPSDPRKPVISTIPLPLLAKMMEVPTEMKFPHKHIFVSQCRVPNCDAYCTMYYPDSNTAIYRATLDGDILIIESTEPIDGWQTACVFESLGISSFTANNTATLATNHKQRYGKILPTDDKKRKSFITQMTIRFNIFSLGRFATWRPKVMMDDVLEDILVIRRLIQGGSYAAVYHNQETR